MKEYSKPTLDIDLFDEADVIACSLVDDEFDLGWFHPEEEDE